ncbi:SDR family NAD(P)-dependent oxidoreductase [Paenibacillus daejeonensis]|uniref:SDR family NAD(P)-dependent oxidoreductase n=1 Tax=Paenibacillus daejeonensis TaxID=135193 RepID=UPI0003708948|nr:SDR family NAD(P)-dependent oxidoreductase [Paenibacillus daejeonensis]
MKEYHGKVVMVTGASQGLGKAMAEAFAERGAKLIVNSVDPPEVLEALVSELRAKGAACEGIRADVSKEEEVADLFARTASVFGRLDVLINNAGISRAEALSEITMQSWEEVLAVNLTGTFLCCKHAMPMMQEQRSGRIIQIASVVAQQGALYGHVHYASSKAGQLAFTKTLARTAAPYGITVNAIAPGIIETELLRSTLGNQKIEALSSSVPLGLGNPRDIAAAALFLASEGARYITGATLDVNGGMHMR